MFQARNKRYFCVFIIVKTNILLERAFMIVSYFLHPHDPQIFNYGRKFDIRQIIFLNKLSRHVKQWFP